MLPAGAKDVKQTNDSIKFTLGKGKAKAAIESLRGNSSAMRVGKKSTRRWQPWPARSLLKEGGGSVTLKYSDTGFMPTEISLSAFARNWKRRGKASKIGIRAAPVAALASGELAMAAIAD